MCKTVMHYIKHRLTASVVTTVVTYASANDQWSVRQKLNRASSVQLRPSVHALIHNVTHDMGVQSVVRTTFCPTSLKQLKVGS